MVPWQQVFDLFDVDDGSLPDVFVDELSRDEVVDIYDWIMSHCSGPGSRTAWSISKQADVPIADLPSPARAYLDGEVETFRHVLADLSIGGVPLQDMTVCMEDAGLSIDYRKGPQWTETTINALLELLARIQQRAPGARIWHSEERLVDISDARFPAALRQYATERS